MIKRLKVKFVIIMMSVVTIMLIVVLGLLLYFTQQNLKHNSIEMMRNLASEPNNKGRPNDLSKDVRLPFFTIQLDQQGELVTSVGSYYDLSDEDFLRDITNVVMSFDEQTGVISAYNLRFLRVVTPTMQKVVFVDISSEIATMRNLWQICLFGGLFSFSAFLLLSIFLASWAVKPVVKAWEQQNRFVADASHELKTPLSVILTNAEIIHALDCDQETRLQSSENILTMSRQMRGLVEKLLDLTRADNESIKTTMSQINFSELVSEAILPFDPLFYEKALTLSSDIESNINVNGSDLYLKQVIEILLDNALKYASPNTIVNIRLIKHSQFCLLSVSNSGIPIPSEELNKIFDRFYRVDKARGNSGSYGLGLAIALSIIKEHGGRIWAESHDSINSFYVQLPIII